MNKIKKVKEVLKTKEVLEGAGVRLQRGFANSEVPRFDPFLLFDDFTAKNPADYLSGFPWHPHRGIETVTYILDGDVRHRDSIGNSGVISSGDIQWMSAGSGIIHEEMPEGTGGVAGFQLWVNLPKKEKMSAPRYQDIRALTIPEIVLDNGALARVIAGNIGGVAGPVKDIVADPLYLDITLLREKDFLFPVLEGYTSFIYIIEGALAAVEGVSVANQKGDIVLFDRAGDTISLRSGNTGTRFLLISGKPLGESVAWHGPIVMNTQAELHTAFEELQEGRFIKK